MDIKIESNVPLTRKYRSLKKPGRQPKYSLPLTDMKTGDSIFIPIGMYSDKFEDKVNKGKDYVTHYVNNTIRSHIKRLKLKSRFTIRQVLTSDGKAIGARVWRVS